MLASLFKKLQLTSPRTLKKAGVLGMNQRNTHYIGQNNDRRLYPNVDDKLKTKQLAIAHGVHVPELISVVRYQYQINDIFPVLKQQTGFAIKPAQGSGGKGILVIVAVDEKGFKKPSGEYLTERDISGHLSNILAGLFSLGGKNDVAVVEALIGFSPIFNKLSFEGVPDIRLIIFRGFPVMAMLRLATKASDGKANLHQGAIGVGLDIATGKANFAVQFDRPISIHPDTQGSLTEVNIPNWDELLSLSSRCYEMSGLGYLGADLVLDKDRGPLILELNARPGLAIQIANNVGLKTRLEHIEKMDMFQLARMDADARVAYAKEHFGDMVGKGEVGKSGDGYEVRQ